MSKKPVTKKKAPAKAPVKAAAKPKKAVNKKAAPKPLDKHVYPIGKHTMPEAFTDQLHNKMILEIGALPDHLKSVARKVKKKKLQNRYRDGGWTIEQLIHHLADSHMNAYIRVKLALTENNPTVKPYDENLWAETADVQACSVKDSIRILRGLHKRWAAILSNLSQDDWKRTYYHPARKRTFTLEQAVSEYVWHGKHHVAQIEVALKK